MTTTEQVNVQVRHGLATVRVAIHDEAITLRQPQFLRQLHPHQHEMPQEGLIGWRCVVECANLFSWNDEHMRRGLWIDVVEREAKIVFVGDLRRDGLVEDFQEDVIGKHVGFLGFGL